MPSVNLVHATDADPAELRFLREIGMSARLMVPLVGGDEFAVNLPEADVNAAHTAAAHTAAARITAAFAESSFHVSERSPVPIGASAGVAAFPSDARIVGELITIADADLYRAKRAESEPMRAEAMPEPTGRSWDPAPPAGYTGPPLRGRAAGDAEEAGHAQASRLVPPVASPGPA